MTFTSCGFRGELFHWQPNTFLMIDHPQKPKIKSSALDKWIGSSSNLFTSYLSLLNLNVTIDSKPNRWNYRFDNFSSTLRSQIANTIELRHKYISPVNLFVMVSVICLLVSISVVCPFLRLTGKGFNGKRGWHYMYDELQ